LRFSDILRLVISHLMNRGLRSWLTVLGIVIGVTAVVAIVSIGEGMQKSITEQFSKLGADTITITPGYSGARGRMVRPSRLRSPNVGVRSGNLTEKDLTILKTIPGVKYVNGMVSKKVDITYLAETARIELRGVDPKVWRYMTTTELVSGRFLKPGDKHVAVIGNRVANGLFKQPIELNRQINIGGLKFKVVGILGPSVNWREDLVIFIPTDAAREVMRDVEHDQFTSIVVQVEENANITEISKKIEEKLLISHQISADKKDFTISTPLGIQARVKEITHTLTLYLAGIAAVSLLVGGIGIANTMFMSVMERTRQIGILKALGATDKDVMKIFLLEAGLMGFIGGVLGILFGMMASGVISEMGIRFMGRRPITTTVIPFSLIIFALIFSLLIGMLAGLLPARKAAKLQPVEALRYE